MAQLARAAKYTDCITVEGLDSPYEYPGYDTKQLGNAEYPFIATAPRFTLARSGSTW